VQSRICCRYPTIMAIPLIAMLVTIDDMFRRYPVPVLGQA